MSILIDNIGQLVTNADPEDPRGLGIIEHAAVVVDNDIENSTDGNIISWVGSAADAPACDERIDLEGKTLVPGFVDSHSHIVFAGDRGEEFAARMEGQRYTGGGIAMTVAATRAASEAQLLANARHLVDEARAQGTTTVEVKSGYALSTPGEQKLLRVAGQVTSETTFLGGHVVPIEYAASRDAYVDLVAGVMVERCAPLAKWADVFCEPHAATAFDGDESRAILEAAAEKGLGLRIHGAQLGFGPGPSIAVELGCASIDHATFLTDDDVALLADHADSGGPVVTFLPIVEFSTKQPYPDARRVLDAGITVALATDCNPGTCFSNSMPLAIAMAVRDFNMTPAEALWSATAGGAAALRRTDIGRIRPGARADFCIINAPSYVHLMYRPGVPIAHALELSDTRTTTTYAQTGI